MTELYDDEHLKVNCKSFLFLLALLTTLSSCASWLPDAAKIDIPQGNKLEAKQIAQLKVGLTKEQVLYLLGESILTPKYTDNNWQYLYYIIKAGDKPKNIKVLDIYFENNKVSSFTQTTR